VGYRYDDQEGLPRPLYPFEYGLSYTEFELLDVKIVQQRVLLAAADKNIDITVQTRVKNMGQSGEKVVVQFCVADCNISQEMEHDHAPRLPKELRAFRKIALDAGEARHIVIALDKDAVSFYNAAQMCCEARSGAYKVLAGLLRVDITHSIDFIVDEGFKWTGV